MSVYSVRQDYTSKVKAHRLFTALVPERHVVLLKVLPQNFKSIEIVQGDGGVGTIKRTDFSDDFPYRYMVYRIDEMDKENLYGKCTYFEGDGLDKYGAETMVYEIKFEETNQGSRGYEIIHYHPKPGCEVKKDQVGVAINLFKKVEEYLLANPDIYA
uniref:Pathogenesis related class 10 protein n=1 Tax=Hypericum tomentosum TaxID=1137039 RepID=A0A1C9KD00_9ROSI|nr:phenolic oxidative coupling protein POCP1 [Hypericum tomentosum]